MVAAWQVRCRIRVLSLAHLAHVYCLACQASLEAMEEE